METNCIESTDFPCAAPSLCSFSHCSHFPSVNTLSFDLHHSFPFFFFLKFNMLDFHLSRGHCVRAPSLPTCTLSVHTGGSFLSVKLLVNLMLLCSFCFQILLIIASVIGIIVYRLSVFIVFSTELPETLNGTVSIQKYLTPQTATSITASLISFVIIMILNIIYEKVAIMITNFGNVLL